MKKVILAALAAAVCVAAAGCSDDKDSNTTDPESSVSSPSVDSEDSQASSDTAVQTAEESDPSALAQEDSAEQSGAEESENAPDNTDAAVVSEAVSQESWAELLSAYDNTYLGLPSVDKAYIFSDADITAEIDGSVCHAVSCYDEYEGTLYYMCDFYITEDGSTVYRRYEQEDSYALLPESEGYARLDPTSQSAESIFAAANGLYMMFCPYDSASVAFDESDSVERGGVRYYRVTDELVDTKAELLDSLSKYFSDSIVNSLMDTERFIDADGALYVKEAQGSMAASSVVESVYELTILTEDTAVFTGYDIYENESGEADEVETLYTAEKQYGIWRFTDFPSPWA